MALAKVFRIELVGAKDVEKGADRVRQAFKNMSAEVRKAKADLTKQIASGADTKMVDELRNKIKQLEISLKELSKERKTAERQAKEQAQAEKLLADVKVKEAQATRQQALADESRTRSMIAQEKELDRLIALEEKRKKIQPQNYSVGSIVDTRKQISELNALTIRRNSSETVDWRGQLLSYDQAIAKLKELTAVEQEFRRQFQRDGTLVGEYTSGIINAFRNMGIDDIITNQINGGKKALGDLEKKTNDLVVAYRKAQQEGSQDLNKLEKEIHENVLETQKLAKTIQQTETQLKGVGNIGNQITSSISNGFKSLKNNFASFALQYIGFQAAFNKLSSEFSGSIGDAKQVEGVKAAFDRLNDANLLDNLRKATRGTVDDLKLMQITVQATNFQIPTQQLGFLLDFARRRAKETGQSVDYLVESIVTGIGRKSPLILDNLGISALRLREKLKGIAEESANVGDVAKAVAEIIAEENAKAGKEIDTQGEKVQQNEAKWKNLRIELGEKLLPVLIALTSAGISIASAISMIPFPLIIAGITGLTGAWALYRAEQIRSYLVTQILTRQGLIYNAYLLVQAARTRIVALVTKAATYELILFNGAIRISPLGFLLTMLALVVPALAVFARNAKAAKTEQQALNDVNNKAAESYNKQIAAIDAWVKVIKSASTSADTKRAALQKLIDIDPAFRAALKNQTIDLDALDAAYKRVIESIKLKAKAEASSTLTAEKEQRVSELALLRQRIETEFMQNNGNVSGLTKAERNLLYSLPDEKKLRNAGGNLEIGGIRYDYIQVLTSIAKQQKTAQQELVNYLNIKTNAENDLNNFLGNSAKDEAAKYEVDIGFLRKRIEDLDVEIQKFQGSKSDLDKKVKERESLQDQLDKLLGKEKRNRPYAGSKLTGEQKDLFKDIDAERDRLRAQLEKAKLEQTEFNGQIIDNESLYLEELLKINVAAIDKKLKLLKGKSAEERKIIAELNLEKIKIETETNEKLFDIANAENERQLKRINDNAQFLLDQASDDPLATQLEKAKAQTNFFETVYSAQLKFNIRQQELEKKYKINSVKNEEDRANAIKAILRALIKARQDEVRAAFQDQVKTLNEVAAIQANELKQRIAKRTEELIASDLSPRKIARELSKLEKEGAKGLLAVDVAKLKLEVDVYKKALEQKLISEKEYSDKLTELKEKEAALYKITVDAQITATERLINALKDLKHQFLENVIGIKQYSKDAEGDQEKVNDAINSSLSTIKSAISEAYNGHFRNEEERIERAKQAQLDFLDREKERVLATAGSEAERSTIERQFAQKRRDEEKKAADEKKRLALKQLAIDFAVTVFKSLAQYGLPLALIPIAAATVMYAVQRGNIQKQQFAEGGKVQPTRLSDGLITTRSNISQQPNGDNVLATVKTGEVILNEKQQRALGGARVFKALGVPGFASGGAVGLGTKIKAPSFNNGFYSSGINDSNEERMQKLENMHAEILEAVYASDSKEVQLVTKKVTNAQSKDKRDTSVATI